MAWIQIRTDFLIRVLNFSVVLAVTTVRERLFQRGIVLGIK